MSHKGDLAGKKIEFSLARSVDGEIIAIVKLLQSNLIPSKMAETPLAVRRGAFVIDATGLGHLYL